MVSKPPKDTTAADPAPAAKPISLAPLSFDDAVRALAQAPLNSGEKENRSHLRIARTKK